MSRITRFFIDESGNTGDAAHTGEAFRFAEQPICVLACIGPKDERSFAEIWAELKARHRLRGPEVKSDSVWRKPGFYMDLIVEIERLDLPLLLEVADKRFFIAAHMVNTLVLPPVGQGKDHTPQWAFMRNAVAEYIAEQLPRQCLTAFVDACVLADGPALLRVYVTLLGALDAADKDNFRDFVRRAASDRYGELRDCGPDDVAGLGRYLPIPDLNTRGKRVWMLPHLSSLTNLYARLNTYTRGRLNGVSLVHDEQLQFGAILQGAKAAVEEFAGDGFEAKYGSANYGFREAAELTFVGSHRSAGIQAADVVAGYAMRILMSRIIPRVKARNDGDWQLRRLLDQDDPKRGLGTNFVMTTANMRAIGISRSPDPYRLYG